MENDSANASRQICKAAYAPFKARDATFGNSKSLCARGKWLNKEIDEMANHLRLGASILRNQSQMDFHQSDLQGTAERWRLDVN